MSGIPRKIWLLPVCAAGLAGFLILITSALFYTSTVQRAIQKKISHSIPGTIEWEGMKISIFNPGVEIKRLYLGNLDNQAVLSVKSLKITVDVLSLLKKEIVFSDIRVDSPIILLSVDQKGTVNIVSALVPPEDVLNKKKTTDANVPYNTRIASMTVENARLEVKIPHQGVNASAARVSAHFSDADVFEKKGALKLKVSDIIIKTPDFDQSLQTVELETEIKDSQLIVTQCNARSGETHLDVSGRVNDIFKAPIFDLKVTSGISLSQMSRTLKLENDFKGKVAGQLSFKGSLENPVAEVSLQAASLLAFGHKMDQAAILLLLKEGNILMGPSIAVSDLGTVKVSGRMKIDSAFPDGLLTISPNLGNLAYSMDIDLEKVNINSLLPNTKKIAGNLTSSLHLNGKGIDPDTLLADFTSHLSAEKMTSPVLREPVNLSLDFAGSLKNNTFFISRLESVAAEMMLTVNGKYKMDTGRFDSQFSLSGEDIHSLAGILGLPASGRLSFHGKGSGTVDQFETDVKIIAEKLSIEDIKIEHLSGAMVLGRKAKSYSGFSRLTAAGLKTRDVGLENINIDTALSGGVLTINRMVAQKNRSRLELSGDIRLFETEKKPGIISPEMDIQVVDTRLFLEDFLTDAKGRLSVNGGVKGTVDNLMGHVDLKGEKISARDISIDAIEIKTLLAGETVYVKQLQIDAAPGAVITGSGSLIPKNKSFQVDLLASAFPLSAVPVLKARGLESGLLDMTVKGQGTIANPIMQSRVIIRDAVIQHQHLPVLNVDFYLNDRLLTAKGNMGGKLEAFYHLDQRSFNAKLEMETLELSPYFKMAGQTDFSGRVNGIISAKGVMDDLKTVSADVDLSDLLLFFRQKEAVRAEKIRVSMSQEQFVLKDTQVHLFEKGTAMISGKGESTKNMQVSIDAKIPLEIMDPFVEEIYRATGQITLSAKIGSNLMNPEITGLVHFEDIGMSLSSLGHSLKQINGIAKITRDKIQISDFTGFLGDGDFSINGEADISGMRLNDAALTMEAHHLPLDFPDQMDLNVDTRLKLTGNMEKSSLKGEIVLLEGRYYKDIKLDLTQIGKQKRPPQPERKTKQEISLEQLSLDINVIRREPLLVENNLATLHISPDLHIHGSAGAPLINGRAQVDTGVIRFQKKEFDVRKGVIDFVNPYRIEPVLDLEAVVDIRTWTIFLSVSGPPENLDFNFRSEPQEQHADIVSLLAFGKTTRELRTGQGGTNFTPAQILAGFVAETVQNNLKDISGMDYVEIGVSGGAGNSGYGGAVTIGKNLSRQLTVKYGVDMQAGETVQRVTTDYKIFENLLMSGYQESSGDFGGALKYRLEFR